MQSRALSEVAEVVPGTSPKGEFITSNGLGYPFFQGVKEFGAVYPTAERYTEKPTRLARAGDILFSVRAPVGRTNIATVDCAIGRGVMAIRPNSSQDRNYLLYFLRSIEDKWDSLGSTGSVFESITVSNLRELSVAWPENRLEASRILWKIDEKIRINQQISSTLEQIAQTVFKSWFIDFEPVSAKARGEQPIGMDAETASLFPDVFEESELGPIPAGWEIKSLTELAEYRNGLALQKYPAKGDGTDIPVLKIPQLKANSVDGAGFASSEVPDKFVINDGDCIFSWSSALEVRIWHGGLAALNQHLFKVVPLETPTWNAYLHTLNHLEEFRAIAESKATTMGHIKRADLENAKFASCPPNLIKRADEVIAPLLSELVIRGQQNRSLTQLRDSLLPRLISGELEIPAELLEA